MIPLADLAARTAQPGRIEAILLRPERLAPPERVSRAELGAAGLEGDHGRAGKRAVTLFQAEHLAAVAAFLGRGEPLEPEALRRNLVVSGLNLSALRGRRLRLGPTADVEVAGPCAPCSRMEAALGYGGHAAMRGHGGWCASVVAAGPLAVGDAVVPLDG